MIRRWVERWFRGIALEAARDIEDQVAEDLELCMAWRRAMELLPPRWALTLASTGSHATACIFVHSGGRTQKVYDVGGDTPLEALDKVSEWLR